MMTVEAVSGTLNAAIAALSRYADTQTQDDRLDAAFALQDLQGALGGFFRLPSPDKYVLTAYALAGLQKAEIIYEPQSSSVLRRWIIHWRTVARDNGLEIAP